MSPKRQVAFDPATIRLEMDARAEELSPHELKILANNFKELAQLISTMADNRSKATLMRRGDDVAVFGDLQKRLGRKQVGRGMLDSHPAGLRGIILQQQRRIEIDQE